jgi:threonyl-tRNA synthetase
VVLPIADRHIPYAASVRDQLRAAGLRVEVDERQEKIGYKIREAQLQKVPYMLVIGDRESTEGHGIGADARRRRSGRESRSTAFIASARFEVRTKQQARRVRSDTQG